MTNRTKKLLSILAVAITLVMITIPVFAFEVGEVTYNPKGNASDTSESAENIMNTIIGIVQVIGIAIAVIMLIFVAIKYLTSAPNDKAEIKKHAVVYVVGAVALFGASGILGIIKDFANQL